MNKLIEDIRGAVARGYCHTENVHKVLDADLCDAIVIEVAKLFHAEDREEKMKCKECDGQGWYTGMVGQDTPEQIQCQNCLGTGCVI